MPKGGPDPYRVLGSSALASDLHAVTFNGAHVFQEGETVLVPRTRGGFTYGQVDRIYPKRIQCHLDKAVSHSILEYQVVVEEYPEVIVKGLPAAYIGKLRLSESPYDEDDDSENRIVGGSPLVTDLRNMVFGSSKVHTLSLSPLPHLLLTLNQTSRREFHQARWCWFLVRREDSHMERSPNNSTYPAVSVTNQGILCLAFECCWKRNRQVTILFTRTSCSSSWGDSISDNPSLLLLPPPRRLVYHFLHQNIFLGVLRLHS
jgi:hypothetical protein